MPLTSLHDKIILDFFKSEAILIIWRIHQIQALHITIHLHHALLGGFQPYVISCIFLVRILFGLLVSEWLLCEVRDQLRKKRGEERKKKNEIINSNFKISCIFSKISWISIGFNIAWIEWKILLLLGVHIFRSKFQGFNSKLVGWFLQKGFRMGLFLLRSGVFRLYHES